MSRSVSKGWCLAAIGGLALGLLVTLAGCGSDQDTRQAIQQAKEQAARQEKVPEGQAQIEQTTAGSFHLHLTGDLTRELEGQVGCTLDEDRHELRLALHAADPSFPYSVNLALPDYAGTGEYDGELEITGPQRSLGSVQAGADETTPAEVKLFRAEIKLSFRGDYLGAAGNGKVEGSATCRLPPDGAPAS